ncbi:MAG: NERD domain-containing protein [Chloroflexota bacterium]
MAHMIPEAPAAGTSSRAELALFEVLRDKVSDAYTVFHHVAWLGRDEEGRAKEGEADFVVSHATQGTMVLEVKGGAISYRAATDSWTSGPHPIGDPFGQARRSAHALEAALRSARGGGRYRIGQSVAFPDTSVMVDLKPDAPKDIVVSAADLPSLEPKLRAILEYWRDGGRGPVPSPGLVRGVLANSFDLRAPLSHTLRSDERALMRLTEGQYRVLDMLARQTRVAIAGCAGSGKTFIAAEKARRLAAQGFRVLVTCFNLMLAESMRRGLVDVSEIEVLNYDEICEKFVREFGKLPSKSDLGGAYYNEVRSRFGAVADRATDRYDALIVDEAQDFLEDWWLPMQVLLADPDRSPLYVFFDDNQSIFHRPPGLPISGEPIQLTVNCRNTQSIHALVAHYYKGATIEALGPSGLPIEVHSYKGTKDLLAQLDESVKRWIRDAEVPPGDIALLTTLSPENSALWKVDRLGGVALTDDPWDTDKILRCGVFRFKGLERLLIAFVEIDGVNAQVLYVGASRAKTYLAVFCPAGDLKQLPYRLQQRVSAAG